MLSLERKAQHATVGGAAAETEEESAAQSNLEKKSSLGSVLQPLKKRAEAELNAYCIEPVIHGNDNSLLCRTTPVYL